MVMIAMHIQAYNSMFLWNNGYWEYLPAREFRITIKGEIQRYKFRGCEYRNCNYMTEMSVYKM